jgi:uncharacterized protein YjeT (DUF2065 family)
MDTIRKVIGGLMLAEGAAIIASPHGYLKMWAQRSMPRWVREQAKPWLKMPESTLRLVGASMVVASGLMLTSAHE